MSLSDRIVNIIKQKVNKLIEKHEDPREALDYSAVKQTEMIQRLRRDIIEITASKKRLEMQKSRLQDNIKRLDDQAISAVKSGRDDLARLALERKNANLSQIKDLDNQILEIQNEQTKLQEAESRLSAKIESFKSRKEIIKAKYSAAEAQVRVKENLTGISEEMSDIGVAISRAEEKTEALKSKSMAIDEMIDSGMLTDYTNSKDQIDMELERAESKEKVESELAKLKSSLATK
ncbi:PspA/IM30 family protein [Candidatus Nitrosocosmicus franklandus]|uniref:Phage shock protein A n=1 Tax=Candidatus Nitrosocosmicus franklandianus TaxID=1798806 RepID=A0A484I9F0_9ARCH|nr:PspA/IM30 family protein [Candidatus Nitrosocosmicus franklandus]VFJ13736.1 Phage shock protein A [Candidatus Nitrosocosmicus franklandus]